MRAFPGKIAPFVGWVALIVGCAAEGKEFSLPRTFQLGEPIEVLRSSLSEDCGQTEELRYKGEMAAPFDEQIQVNCSDLEVFGAHRDVEFMFNDGPLGHVWIHVRGEEVAELRGISSTPPRDSRGHTCSYCRTDGIPERWPIEFFNSIVSAG